MRHPQERGRHSLCFGSGILVAAGLARMSLRPYQTKLKAEVYAAWDAGAENVLAVMPTGAGKTRTVAAMVAELQEPTAIIAHRQELVGQLSVALAREGVRHGIVAPASVQRDIVKMQIEEVGASYFDPNARTKVAGVDTMIRLPANDPWLKQVRRWVQDEAHHITGDPRVDNCPHMNKWGKAAKMLPNARGLGVTATPARADKKGLGRGYGGLMDHMVLGPEMMELMRAHPDPFLTQYDVRWPESDVDYSQVRTTASGDLSQKGLAAAVRKSHIVGDVVDCYLKFAPGKRGITFTVDVEEATKQAEAYNARGVPAAVIHGAMPDVERIKLMRRFKAGQLLQLCNCDILGEGVDVPAVEVVSMARKTMSLPLYMQQGGRMLRPFPGKSRGLLIDHVGNFAHHKPLQLRRLWSLAGEVRLARAADGVPMRACPQCTAAYERFYPACPFCGHEPVPAGRSTPEQVDGDLTLLDAAAIAELCRAEEEAMAPPVFRLPYGASPGIVHSLQQAYSQRLNQHHATKEAQDSLREAMAQWGGVATYREGLDMRTAWRKFFHVFGIDVRSARALDAERAGQLEQQIRKSIEQ